jgi:hypothetical protein
MRKEEKEQFLFLSHVLLKRLVILMGNRIDLSLTEHKLDQPVLPSTRYYCDGL